MEPITGIIVCGANEASRYFEQTLRSITKLTNRLVVVLCNATGKEMEMAIKYKAKIRVDNREWGKYQAQIKSDTHKMLTGWVLALDADEVVDEQITIGLLQQYQDRGPKAYHFYLVNHWDAENKWRNDMSFWRVHYYQATKEYGQKFGNGSFDPGLVPEWAASHASYMPIFVRHFGLMKKEDRERKVQRYEKYDPGQVRLPKDYYEALKANTSGEAIDLNWLREELVKQTKDIPLRPYKPTMAIQKFHYVKRKVDGVVLDIPDNGLADLMKGGKFEYVSAILIQTAASIQEVPIIDEELPVPVLTQQEGADEVKTGADPLVCVLCGFKGANTTGLKRHKTRKHEQV